MVDRKVSDFSAIDKANLVTDIAGDWERVCGFCNINSRLILNALPKNMSYSNNTLCTHFLEHLVTIGLSQKDFIKALIDSGHKGAVNSKNGFIN